MTRTPTRRGRPSSYTKKRADAVCQLIASGLTLRTACEQPGMPAMRTVFGWMARHEEFEQAYARARQSQMDAMAEDLLEIADERDADARDRQVRIDARKWLMARLASSKYGDRSKHEHTGAEGGPIVIEKQVFEK